MIDLIARFFLKNGSTAAQKRTVYGYVCGIVGIILNLFLFAAKLTIGTVSGSISITADAFNNFSDAGSSIITVFGFILSGRKADKDHPFGHGRIEYICGILVSVIIIIVGGELFLSSAEKIFAPSDVTFSIALCIVLAISVLVKFYMYFYNSRCGKKIGSETLKAVASDSIGDCIATLAVLVCSVISHFTNVNLDAYVGAVVSVLIIRAGIVSVMETASPLLGRVPDSEFVDNITNIVNASPYTRGIHDLVVHDYGPGKRFVSLHMEVDGSGNMFELHDEVDSVEKRIAEELGCEVVIHMDPIDINNPVISELSVLLKNAAHEKHAGIHVHDLRMVPGPTHTNVIFDVAIPADLFGERDDIEKMLAKTVKEYNKNFFSVINSELSYTE